MLASRIIAAICLAWLLLGIQSSRADTREQSARSILGSHCVACHGPRVQNADVRLDNLSADLLNDRRAAETWHDVRNVLHQGKMPPSGAPQLAAADRETLVEWLEETLATHDEARRHDKGAVVMRRLNRMEYQNTMRDLLGLEIDYVRNLPPDEVSPDGFTNNGSSLRISALQLEHYLSTARSALARAIVEGPPPPVYEHRAVETVVDKLKTVHWSNRLGRTGTFVARVPEFPDQGEFVLRVRARAEIPDGAPYPRMHVALGYRADTQTPSRTVAEVDVAESAVRTFEFRGRVEEFPIQSRSQSKYPGMLIWVRNIYSDGQPAPLGKKVRIEVDGKRGEKIVWPEAPEFPAIIVEEVEFRAPVYSAWPPPQHRQLLPESPESEAAERRIAEDAVRRFARRAYRRPSRAADMRSALAFFDRVRPTVSTFEQALRETLAMMLISPDFLFLVENSGRKGGRLDDHELATRLSYFLWSTMPDERLMALADRGRLGDQEVLRGEALRMLDDPRSSSFVNQFTDQWLDLGGVDRIAVNPNYYPDFDLSLKADMRSETQQYFATLLREDLSALNLLRSDFAVVNERMARHYGLAGPRGGAFERVFLLGADRVGGLLTHASVLLSNSTGEDSHPVERGVWIRTVLLGDPPASPPPAVPNLASSPPETGLLPIRKQLELHRDNAACAHCHRRIDPWGIALERFDAVGKVRDSILRRSGEREERHAVDASTTLPDGHQIDGAEALASYLLDNQSQRFARALTLKLLAYALGRTVGRDDAETVNDFALRFERSGYSLRKLCTIIVTSDEFRSR